MADDNQILALTGLSPPFDAQVQIGGAFPIEWNLFDVVQTGNQWTWTAIAHGNGDGWQRLPFASLNALNGHYLVWKIALINFDSETIDGVQVIARVRGAGGAEQKTSGTTTIDAGAQKLSVAIQLGA
jgi:hypothetical protein